MKSPDAEENALRMEEALEILRGSSLGILTTVDAEGFPHATWMSAFTHDIIEELLTITSPDSEKVANLEQARKAEWMFTNGDKSTLLYLRGRTEVVEDVSEIKQCWARIPDKAHTYFMQYYNTGIGFAIIRTTVKEITLVYPREFRKVQVI